MLNILVVDDTEMDRRVIGGLLEKQAEWSVAHAADGFDALAQVRERRPDIIVTDMLMPEMNGLELVDQLRKEFPGLPVVLVTAHGNESLAVDALDRGAASYVPKSQLSFKLVDTVKQVLATVEAHKTHDQLVQCLAETQSTFYLDNAPELIPRFAELALQMADALKLCDANALTHLGVALAEALLNAMLHGNLEMPPGDVQQARSDLMQDKPSALVEQRRSNPVVKDRKVYVQTHFTREEARFVIRDEGGGFDVSTVPQRGDPKPLETDSGRGLVLMQNFMDEVAFNDRGNQVTLVKRRGQ